MPVERRQVDRAEQEQFAGFEATALPLAAGGKGGRSQAVDVRSVIHTSCGTMGTLTLEQRHAPTAERRDIGTRITHYVSTAMALAAGTFWATAA